jgi:precorrin-2 dehydrogenase / sirohydrochlorin ferrochelatase
MGMDEQNSLTNRYYPLFIDLKGKTVVVVGGGVVALRKVESLRRTGASVKVIAPEVVPEIAGDPGVEIVLRSYTPGDLFGACLVIAATDNQETNIAVSRDASLSNVLCNVVDKPDLCSFIVPSVVEKGPIKIAISTGGISPTLSKRLRAEIGRFLGDEYATLALIMGRIRSLVLSGEGGFESHKMIFEILINSELIDAIRDHDRAMAEKILFDALDEHIDLTEIMP